MPVVFDAVEGALGELTGVALGADSLANTGRVLTLRQTNDVPFFTGPDSVGPATQPAIKLSGRPNYFQSGIYTVHWSMADTTAGSPVLTATTTVVVHDLFPPVGIRAYYTPDPKSLPIPTNGTGVLNLVVWDGTGPDADPIAWHGYRVRRTIHGISPHPLEVAGQHLNIVTLVRGGTVHIPASPLCLSNWTACTPDSFVYTGSGLFFKGFQNNSLGNGRYAIDYPPGAPADNCASCWVFVDVAAQAGFITDYTVTTLGPFDKNDYIETPLADSPVVTIYPGTPPADNLERVAVVPNPFKGSAAWDPAVGEGRIHFIHIPDGSTVRVFTANGELVRELKLDASSSPGGSIGDLAWDLRNGEGKKVVSGIYLYQVETPQKRTRKGHFVIIK
ncbi:MAG TPA: hypothetical protein VF363_10030 [Candidatus Eisenbacteria bacterium]